MFIDIGYSPYQPVAYLGGHLAMAPLWPKISFGHREKLFGTLYVIIIIMNFYSPVSNTKCHSIGHKMRIARIKIRVDSKGRWEKSLGRESNFEEVCFEPGTEYW